MILYGDPGDEQAGAWLDDQPAQPANAPRHEHEWEAHGELHRVRWDFARDRWTAQTMLRGEWRYQWPSGSFDAVAAEIARLAGLTKPEEES